MCNFKFSEISKKRLLECNIDLQILFNEVIKYVDCSILCGHRNEKDQMEALIANNSKLAWPHSKHNRSPSWAIDVLPYPIDWNDIPRCIWFGGYVQGIANILYAAHKISYNIRWGGDWDNDHEFKDQVFYDYVHFELLK